MKLCCRSGLVERRTPWAFDDALADASVRFEGVGKAIRYDEGGVIAETD